MGAAPSQPKPGDSLLPVRRAGQVCELGELAGPSFELGFPALYGPPRAVRLAPFGDSLVSADRPRHFDQFDLDPPQWWIPGRRNGNFCLLWSRLLGHR